MNINELADIIYQSLDEAHGNSAAKYLLGIDKRRLACAAVEAVHFAVIKKSEISKIGSRLGNTFRSELDLSRCGILGFKGGYFLLTVLGDIGMIDIYRKKSKDYKHPPYYPKITNWKMLNELFADIDIEEGLYIYPELNEPKPWTSSYHEDAGEMIKKAKKSLLNGVSPESHPMLFDVLNNKQNVGYRINPRIIKVYRELFDANSTVFEHNNPLLTDDQKNGKYTEARAVLEMAESIGDREFWHHYNFDFRGRIYPVTAYLHELSSDNAKGLLYLDEKVALGKDGYQWLLQYAAASWGEDKLSINDRIQFSLENLDTWLDWAVNPSSNLGWLEADKPWSFLSVIQELLAVRFHGNPETFMSGLIIYIDGTTNGSQHLTALAKDHTIAHHVNLVPTDKPGDLYTLIANASYDQIMSMYDPGLDGEFERVRADLMAFYQEVEGMSNIKERNDKWTEIMDYKKKNEAILIRVAPQFWLQENVTDKKRKIAKRNVMTLGYGSETVGFSDQLLEDCPKMLDELKFIERKWTWFMADLNFKNCMSKLPGPARMLSLFKQLAILANGKSKQFAWTVPITNFPAIQTYFDPESARVEVKWKGERVRFNVITPEISTMNKRKQKQSASPNVIHSFDASHLTMTCLACNFQTVTVHDSFGTAAGNMGELFVIVREMWVEFYESDPLRDLLLQHDAIDMMPEVGELDHRAILDSEFAFS